MTAGRAQEAVVRDRAWLDAVRDRVLQDIRERPSIRPYLGEEGRLPPGFAPDRSEATVERRRQQRAAYKRRWRAGRST